jgi:hypothetical protein
LDEDLVEIEDLLPLIDAILNAQKTITPSQIVARRVDKTSTFIEHASRAYLARLEKTKRDARDVELSILMLSA